MPKQNMSTLVMKLVLAMILWNASRCTDEHACFLIDVHQALTLSIAPQSGTKLPEGNYSLDFKADEYSFRATWTLSADGVTSEVSFQDVSSKRLQVGIAAATDASGRLEVNVEFECPDSKLNQVKATLHNGEWKDGFDIQPSYGPDQPTMPWGDKECGVCWSTQPELPEITVPVD